MRKWIAAGSLALFALAGTAFAQDDLIDVCFQSKWFPQAQFVGYFVAQSKGFYEEEGLEVTILDGGTVNPTVQVASGNCDFGTDWIANMLVQRDQGLEVTQIAQIYQTAGYRLVALGDSGIESFADMAGRRVGVWAFGNEFAAAAVFAKADLLSDLDPTVTDPDVEAVVYAFDPALVFPDEVEVASAMTYNELNQIIGLGFPLDVLNVLDPADIGADLLEDLIFVNNDVLASSDFEGSGLSGREVAERFVRASIRGWEYAAENEAESAAIVIAQCGDTCAGSGATQSPEIHQTWQTAEAVKLAVPTPDTNVGSINRADWERSVETLVEVGLISTAFAYEDVVDDSVYDAIR